MLVSSAEGRKDSATERLSGRAEDSRLVHVAVPAGSERPRPGDIVTATITHAAPFHLIADETAPLRVGYPVADTLAGITAAFAIASALVRAKRT